MHRSYLYVPGNRPDRFHKSLDSGTDAVIADLEDGVALSAKDPARDNVVAFLRRRPGRPDPSDGAWTAGPPGGDRSTTTEVLVRVNADDRLEEDVRAVAGPGGARAIYLPKAEMTSIERVDDLLGSIDGTGGGIIRPVEIVALIETARGVLESATIAAHPRVRNLAIGEADLGAELGIEASDDEREWSAIRTQLVLASAAAGIDPPIGPVSTEFRDLEVLRRSTESLRRSGFGARSAIHPAQVDVINEVFTPGPDEVRRAERLVQLFAEAVAKGDGVCLDDEGRMVDEAVVRSARRVLSRSPD